MEPDYMNAFETLSQAQENDKQFIYEYRRKVQSLEALQKEYVEEIEHLNLDMKSLKEKLEIQSEKFLEEKGYLRQHFNEEIQIILEKLAKAEYEVKNLNDEINIYKKTQLVIEHEETPTNSMEQLESNIINLQHTNNVLNEQLVISQKRCHELEETQQILTNDHENVKEALELKKEELKQANELIKNLQDEVMCQKVELESFKNKPLDEESRGNSLFSEVYDSHTQLKKQMKKMAEVFNRMNSKQDSLLSEVQLLRNENCKLIESFETDLKEHKPGNLSEIDSYKFKIDGLEALVESYKKEVEFLRKTQNSTDTPKELKYYEVHLERKHEELKSIRQAFERHTTGHVLQARNYSELGREKAQWKLRAIDAETENQILKNKIELLEAKIQDPKINRLADEVKENQKINEESARLSCSKTKTDEKKHVLNETSIQNVSTKDCDVLEECNTAESNTKLRDILKTEYWSDIGKPKSVRFTADTKDTSNGERMRKGAVVITKHYPITHYAKKK